MGEPTKSTAESFLTKLTKHPSEQFRVELLRGGPRVENDRLATQVAGLHLENPLLLGPGWDKHGHFLDVMHALNFAGTEVGTVALFAQPGNPKPRLFLNKRHGVALNSFGFNSVGVEAVADNLAKQKRPGIVGINVGKNKLLKDDYAPWAYAAAIEKLYDYGDYFVICASSPNTPGLRSLLKPKPLTSIVRASTEILNHLGRKPLFVKTVIDLTTKELNDVIEVLVQEKVDGIIDTNTTLDKKFKTRYGWHSHPGGLSGKDPDFTKKANERMKHITKVSQGSHLQRIGVGGIHDAASAIDRLQAGAQAIQIMTAFLPFKPSLPRRINKGILNYINQAGAKNVTEIVGSST